MGEPVCNWFQQRWDFEELPDVNKLIDETLGRFKKQARDKFPDSAAYIAMCQERLKADSSAFLSRWPGFIFNSDSSGNFYDFPEDLYFDVKKANEKRLGKSAGKDAEKDERPAPSLQQNAYANG